MTTQASIQARVWRGYGVAAAKLGAACQWYRPTGTTPVVVPANSLGTLVAAFDTRPDFEFAAPSKYTGSSWYGLFDPTLVQPGDYLLTPIGQTFFVVQIESLHAVLCVVCSGTMTLNRPAATTPGAEYYSGVQPGTDLVSGWPASLTVATKGVVNDVKLPGDGKMGTATILLPTNFPVQVQPDDVMTDISQSTPVRYVVDAVDRSTLGYRLIARNAGT